MARPLRFALLWSAMLAVLALLPAGAFAGAVTNYAAPGGSGTACTNEKTPCSLTKAVEESVNEDSVSLAPGNYVLPGGGLGIGKEIDIGGQVGAAATTVVDTSGGNVHVNTVAKPTLHDMRIEGTGGLVLNSGTAERLFVSYTGTASTGCGLNVGTVLRNSVCWAHDDGESGADGIEASASGVAGTVVLRNVTALATNSAGDGIRAQSTGSLSKLVVEGTDVIARGDHHPDVAIELNGGGLPVAEVKLANSSFAKVAGELPPLGTVTAPGSNGNQVAAPLFVSPAAGDFREATGSPTVDAGLNDPLSGTGDLVASPRSLPACLGGSPVTDIGAYEALPVDCSPAPPAPPENKFRFGKQKLNKRNGTATLVAIVPGPGALKLSGPGLKTEELTAKATGNVKLSIIPVGKAKKGLAKTGKRKVAPKVTFTPTGGSPFSQAHSMVLHRKLT